ncbi:MAG: HAD hydrolase family protein [Lachnospiraceae bacterium]
MTRVVHLDLDNTLIYSYKHILPDSISCPAVCAQGTAGRPSSDASGSEDAEKEKEYKKCGRVWKSVEIYQGRNISYMTEKTRKLLIKLRKKCLIVPTTTRTVEQYSRIRIPSADGMTEQQYSRRERQYNHDRAGADMFEYALVCNGGVLLVDGESDRSWYEQSRELIADCTGELKRALGLLEREPLRKFGLRFIEELFIFTKCKDPDTVIARLNKELNTERVDVLGNGEKVYVVPKKLNKGTAVRRFREYIGADEVIAAGDSAFDVPMAEAADIGIVPNGFCETYQAEGNMKEMKGEHVFSEEMLAWIDGYIR